VSYHACIDKADKLPCLICGKIKNDKESVAIITKKIRRFGEEHRSGLPVSDSFLDELPQSYVEHLAEHLARI
jgi:hypothetical protein